MLIYINFHPPNDGKRWIRQDYMDSLKNNSITPRFYPTYPYMINRPRFNSNNASLSKNYAAIKQSNESSDNI